MRFCVVVGACSCVCGCVSAVRWMCMRLYCSYIFDLSMRVSVYGSTWCLYVRTCLCRVGKGCFCSVFLWKVSHQQLPLVCGSASPAGYIFQSTPAQSQTNGNGVAPAAPYQQPQQFYQQPQQQQQPQAVPFTPAPVQQQVQCSVQLCTRIRINRVKCLCWRCESVWHLCLKCSVDSVDSVSVQRLITHSHSHIHIHTRIHTSIFTHAYSHTHIHTLIFIHFYSHTQSHAHANAV